LAQPRTAALVVPLNAQARGVTSIEMSVDGAPRSFVWQVDLDERQVQRQRTLTTISMDWIRMAGADGVPERIYRRTAGAPLPAADPEAQPVVLDIGPGDACSFDVHRQGRPLEVR